MCNLKHYKIITIYRKYFIMTTTPKLPFVHKKYIHTKKLDAVEIKPLFRGFMGGSVSDQYSKPI